jgi:hypothetical protein
MNAQKETALQEMRQHKEQVAFCVDCYSISSSVSLATRNSTHHLLDGCRGAIVYFMNVIHISLLITLLGLKQESEVLLCWGICKSSQSAKESTVESTIRNRQ